MSGAIVDILSRKADSAFDLFIAALKDSGQEHVASFLDPSLGHQLHTYQCPVNTAARCRQTNTKSVNVWTQIWDWWIC